VFKKVAFFLAKYFLLLNTHFYSGCACFLDDYFKQGWQSLRRYFAIIVTHTKCDAMMIWTNGFDFFAIIKNF